MRFLDCFTGISGRIHDARVFSLSPVKAKVEQLDLQFHILGDGAYPLSPNVMTPYRDFGNMTEEQTEYNRRFSMSRVKIENSFGLLKNRWQQLIRLDMWHVLGMSKFILACCVLHNLCIERDDFLQEIDDCRDIQNEPVNNVYDDAVRHLGTIKRNHIASRCH